MKDLIETIKSVRDDRVMIFATEFNGMIGFTKDVEGLAPVPVSELKALIDNHQSETDAAIRAERARVVKEFGKVLDCQSFTEAEQVMMLQSLYAQFEEDDTLTAEE